MSTNRKEKGTTLEQWHTLSSSEQINDNTSSDAGVEVRSVGHHLSPSRKKRLFLT